MVFKWNRDIENIGALSVHIVLGLSVHGRVQGLFDIYDICLDLLRHLIDAMLLFCLQNVEQVRWI